MSAPLISIVTLIYLAVSIDLWHQGNPGMSLCFAGYTVANLGLLVAMSPNATAYLVRTLSGGI